MSMQILTREICQPCDGRGYLPVKGLVVRVPCGACDGQGYCERWVDAQKVLSDFAETLQAQSEADAQKVLAETVRKAARRGRDNGT